MTLNSIVSHEMESPDTPGRFITAMEMGLVEDPTRTAAQVVKKPTIEPSKTRVHTSSAIRRALATAEELGLVAPSSAPKEKVREPMVGGWLPPAQHVDRYSQMWDEMQESKSKP